MISLGRGMKENHQLDLCQGHSRLSPGHASCTSYSPLMLLADYGANRVYAREVLYPIAA